MCSAAFRGPARYNSTRGNSSPAAALIEGFEVGADSDGTHHVALRSPAGAARRLPLPLETVAVRIRGFGGTKRLFVTPVSHATFIAARIGEMLEAARRMGHDTHRV
jgi:hypothetical protein